MSYTFTRFSTFNGLFVRKKIVSTRSKGGTGMRNKTDQVLFSKLSIFSYKKTTPSLKSKYFPYVDIILRPLVRSYDTQKYFFFFFKGSGKIKLHRFNTSYEYVYVYVLCYFLSPSLLGSRSKYSIASYTACP